MNERSVSVKCWWQGRLPPFVIFRVKCETWKKEATGIKYISVAGIVRYLYLHQWM